MAKDLKELESEEYKGASKIGNAWAKWTAVSPIAGLAGGLVGGLFSFRTLKAGGENASPFTLASVPISAIATAVSIHTIGAIWGWRQSEHAQQQHKELQEAVKDLRIENEKLASEKKWTERLDEKREAQTHHAAQR